MIAVENLFQPGGGEEALHYALHPAAALGGHAVVDLALRERIEVVAGSVLTP